MGYCLLTTIQSGRYDNCFCVTYEGTWLLRVKSLLQSLRCVRSRDLNEAACLSWNPHPLGPSAALGICTQPQFKGGSYLKKNQ